MRDNSHRTIAFDIDGTLIWMEGTPGEEPDTPRYKIVQLFKFFEQLGWSMYIWSGGGMDYAERWRDKLGIKALVVTKGSFVPDIAVDDEEVKLGKTNIRV